MGLSNYNRRLVKNFASISTHLTRLTQKEERNIIAYASTKLKIHKSNYLMHNLELAAVEDMEEFLKNYDVAIQGISDKDGLLANIEVKPIFIEEIKAKQLEDEKLNKLRIKMISEEALNTTLGIGGVLSFRGRNYVLWVDDLIQNVLPKSHGSRYSIYLGVTRMYRDMRETLLVLGIKKDIA
ncbi:uncharacterized protein LOC129899771 [Solanum dulcamara]|uniref:uncharacterized protein LOC129899771 n=1 Tax=Solanum dulcamara TaxID=45834 RepID=UPI002485D686|nr:uncharacterized protein LOC129899771 [Solanum dulcamara]